MPDDTADPIARLQGEIAALRQAIAILAGFPDLQAPRQADLAAREATLAALRAAPQVGVVTPNRDAIIGTNVQVNNISNQITIPQYLALDPRTKRYHQEVYLAALQDLAARMRARAAEEVPVDVPIDAAAEAELRRIFAQELLTWQLPAPAGETPADDWLRRRLVAALLMPLILDPAIMMRLRYDWALTRLSSGFVTALVLRVGVQVPPGTPDAEQQALRLLTDHLGDTRYAAGCAKLLEDLVDPQRGLPIVVETYDKLPAEQRATLSDGLRLLMIGALTGGLAGALVTLLITELRLHPVEAPRDPDHRPAMPSSPGPLRIPVPAAEWRAELGRRNEQFGAPDGYWCYVRPGTYRIGGWEQGQEEVRLRLDGFWVARVPFTVAQYAQFMRAGGYHTRRWWTPHGWEWRTSVKREQPWLWQDSPFKSRADQVLQGISWYEATACCAWLAEVLELDLPSGYTLRLPSEAEWEATAACGPHGERRSYPWGEQEPTPKLAVFDRRLGDGAPVVGTCPSGTAACGALDLAGTILEMCSSSNQEYPRGAAGLQKDFTISEYHAPLRGGAHYAISSFVRCGARLRIYPVVGLNDFGFRVFVAPRLAG